MLFLMLMVSIAANAQQESRRIASERENTMSFFGGMGIHMVSAPDVVGYINNITLFTQRVDDFGTAVGFYGGVDLPVSAEWGIGVKHQYLFKTYSVPGNLAGIYDIYYSVQAPSVMIERVLKGQGYFVKFSGGGGYHFGYLSQKVSTFGVTTEYTAQGIGFEFDAVGQTAFGDDAYGYIGGSLGWSFLGTLKDDAEKELMDPRSGSPVALNIFHAGIRFGIVFYL